MKLSASVKPKAGGKAVPVTFRRADAEHESVRYQMGQPVIGALSGWKTDPKSVKERQQAVWLLDPVQLKAGDELIVKLSADGLGKVRLATSPVATLDPLRSASELLPSFDAANGQGPVNEELAVAYLLSTGYDKQAYGQSKVEDWSASLLECRNGKTWTAVTESWKPTVTRVLGARQLAGRDRSGRRSVGAALLVAAVRSGDANTQRGSIWRSGSWRRTTRSRREHSSTDYGSNSSATA